MAANEAKGYSKAVEDSLLVDQALTGLGQGRNYSVEAPLLKVSGLRGKQEQAYER